MFYSRSKSCFILFSFMSTKGGTNSNCHYQSYFKKTVLRHGTELVILTSMMDSVWNAQRINAMQYFSVRILVRQPGCGISFDLFTGIRNLVTILFKFN